MASFEVLHHTGTEGGVDWFDITIGIVVVLVLVGVGFGIYKMVERRRGL
jgi:hypothetical protein